MGTRGIFGVVVDGTVKASYNHSDSYPDGLGANIVVQTESMLEDWGKDKMIEQARKLVLVSEESKPTPEQIKELAGFTNLSVHDQTTDDWYCVLRELQGNLTDTLVVGLMVEGGNIFATESMFCEWGYLVNVDNGTLEVYKGFQKSPHDKGRFALPKGKTPESRYEGDSCEYYPIALLATFPLDDIPADFTKMCEFSGLNLFIDEGGKEYTNSDEAIKAMKDGDTLSGYSVWDEDRDLTTKLIRNGDTDFTFIDAEDEKKS